ncbi:MAG TPA: hypothetical protein VFX96_08070, partial [Pyrinomonadaceae bacterium]|nr:hypothetical protein [Pyrinomonadaceae bacterium]
MKRTLTVVLIALCALTPAAAQTQGGRRPAPARGAGRQATRPAPARPTPTPYVPHSTAIKLGSGAPDPVAQACGCESQQPLPDVLAVVNGVKITRADLSAAVQDRVRSYQQQVIDARKRELDVQINSKLLEAEAKKRGTTASKLLQTEVVAKTVAPTDAEVRAFYDQNKARLEAGAGRAIAFEEVRGDVVEYLRYQKEQDAAQKFSERLRAASQVQVLAREVTPPATPAERARVLATVNGEKITSGDIEDALRPLVYQTQEQAYMLRKNAIDTRINDMLLEQEAQKRKVTTDALFQSEVKAKVPVVTEAEAQRFYDENKSRI